MDMDSSGQTPSASSGSSGSSRLKKAIGSAGRSLSSSGQSMMADSGREAASNVHAVSYKRGGKVRKTGGANLHKGERVIPRGKVKKVERMMRKSKMRMKSGRG